MWKALRDIWTLSPSGSDRVRDQRSRGLSLIQKGLDVTRTATYGRTLLLRDEGAKVRNSALARRSYRDRRTQKIAPMRLTGAEMRALLAKKKDQRGRYELCQMVNWTLKCLARRPSLATSRLPNRGSRAWKIAERRPGGRLAFLCRRQSRESSHACRIAQSGNRLPPAAWCRRGLQAA